jgi:hypothetical protein
MHIAEARREASKMRQNKNLERDHGDRLLRALSRMAGSGSHSGRKVFVFSRRSRGLAPALAVFTAP